MIYTFSLLPKITGGKLIYLSEDRPLRYLLTDSRKLTINKEAVFFAIRGSHHDGHWFLQDLYSKGIRQFVVETSIDPSEYPDANILEVRNSIEALQLLAAHHRNQFDISVV